MEMSMATDPFQDALQKELRRGERVLWSGKQLRRFNYAALGIWLFAVPWTGFALFWIYMAAGGIGLSPSDDVGLIGWLFPMFGLPFVAIGLAMMAGPFVLYFSSGNTIFAVTDQRLLSIYVGRKLRSESEDGERIGSLSRSEAQDGSGSLTIRLSDAGSAGKAKTRPQFKIGVVDNVRVAEDAVRQLKDRAKRAVSPSS
jgi:hypothetical protein